MSHQIEISSLEQNPLDVSDETLDNHFIERLNTNLDKIREISIDIHNQNSPQNGNYQNNYQNNHDYHNNSPLTLSNDNSDQDDLEEDPQLDQVDLHKLNKNKRVAKFRNLTHKEVEQSLEKYYDDASTNSLTKYSNELDIMTTYLKGQKNLYIKSMHVSRFKLNVLVFSSLLLSAAVAIFAPFIQKYYWSGGFITALNAIIILLISLANYLKLETTIETFQYTAKQYDKMEMAMEFTYSKILFIQDNDEKSQIILEKIQETERNISYIKEWNQLFIPEEVRRRFPIICSINIFAYIKRTEMQKQTLVAKFKDIKNEIRYIKHVLLKNNGDNDHSRLEKRLDFLLGIKDKIKADLFQCKNAYSQIDEIFTQEIIKGTVGSLKIPPSLKEPTQ